MPKIFDDTTREELKKLMMEKGFQLIKRNGLKKTTIEDVTKESGIARGTFYNFFESKEEFVYNIVVYKRSQVTEYYKSQITENGGVLDRELLKDCLYYAASADYNLFSYLSVNDIAMLKVRWPSDHWVNDDNEENKMHWLLDLIPNKQRNCSWKVFANQMKILGGLNILGLHQDCIDENIRLLIDGIADYVFGK